MLEELKGNLTSTMGKDRNSLNEEIGNIIGQINNHLELSGKLALTDTLYKFKEGDDSLI